MPLTFPAQDFRLNNQVVVLLNLLESTQEVTIRNMCTVNYEKYKTLKKSVCSHSWYSNYTVNYALLSFFEQKIPIPENYYIYPANLRFTSDIDKSTILTTTVMLGPLPPASSKLLLPYLVNGNHWCLVEIDIEKTGQNEYNVTVKLHNPLEEVQKLPENVLLALGVLLKNKLSTQTEASIRLSHPVVVKKKQQRDSSSCGPILVQNIIDIVTQNKNPCTKVYESGAVALREQQLNVMEKKVQEDFPSVANTISPNTVPVPIDVFLQKQKHFEDQNRLEEQKRREGLKLLKERKRLEGLKRVEEQKLQERLEQAVSDCLKPIKDTIAILSTKIGTINQHQHKKAYEVAILLLNRLEDHYKQYKNNLLNSPKSNWEKAASAFQRDCQQAIKKAKPILEKDLGWGDYLKNLLKALVNGLVGVVSLGMNSKGFFTLKQSQSLQEVEQAEQNLTPEIRRS